MADSSQGSMEGLIVSQERRKEGDVVVAIDLGTSRTAALITLVSRFHDIQIPVSLDDSSMPCNTKTVTSILMKDSEGLHFGAKAEQLYASEGSNHSDWHLFKSFKMKLHKSFKKDPLVEAVGGGKHQPLSVILRECFKLAKARVEKTLRDHGLERSTRFWVLTVPGIWSDFAKDMMRTAAFKAGLILAKQSGQLILGLEPECAAVSSTMWGKDIKFMIVDCGGGTVDISSHSIVNAQPLVLRELKPATGGPLGATLVDKEFFSFFSCLLGAKNYQKLEKNHPEEFLMLGRMWEEVKVSYNFEDEEPARPRLLLTDILAVLDMPSSDFMTLVEAWNIKNLPCLRVDLIKPPRVGVLLSHQLMLSFFDKLVEEIVELICEQITDDLQLDYLVLVGGFSKCHLLRRKLEMTMKENDLIIVTSKDVDMAIVKGAAMFGARLDDMISTRKSRCTFGVLGSTEYLRSNPAHRQHKKKAYWRSGKWRLNVFSVHGLIGDDLESQGGELQRYAAVEAKQPAVDIKILVSSRKDVFLDDDEHVKVLARTRIPVDMSVPLKDRMVWVKFCFGGPEVRCRIFGPTKEQEIGTVALNYELF